MSDQDDQQDDTSTEQQPPEVPDADEQESPEDGRDEAWDPERARRKISKANSENKALRERAAAAEKKAADADDLSKQNGDLTAANLRLQVGYELGLPLRLAERLQGSTKEEMFADAEALVELVSPASKPPTNRPAEQFRGGGEPDREPEDTDLTTIGARMFRR